MDFLSVFFFNTDAILIFWSLQYGYHIRGKCSEHSAAAMFLKTWYLMFLML
uniref:Uncharacterized protein n=1 Tax=Anguilla anguilla TaxID=7936 RepID=A0A0E9S5F7_ANGAN